MPNRQPVLPTYATIMGLLIVAALGYLANLTLENHDALIEIKTRTSATEAAVNELKNDLKRGAFGLTFKSDESKNAHSN